MKHFLNFTLVVVLCFCMVPTVKAQEGVTESQYLMDLYQESTIGENDTYGDKMGQSFNHEGGIIYSLAFALYNARGIEPRPGVLTITNTEDPYGDTVFVGLINIPGLEKVASAASIGAVTNISEANILSNTLSGDITSGVYSFDEVKSEHAVNQYFPAGHYTAVISTDPNLLDVYNGGGVGTPLLVCYTNCGDDMICGTELVINPYDGGHLVMGGGIMNGAEVPMMEFPSPNAGRDMAFEVRVYEDLSTFILPSTDVSAVLVQEGSLVVTSDMNGAMLILSDMLGRVTKSELLKAGKNIPLPKDEVVFITLVQNGSKHVTKVILGG